MKLAKRRELEDLVKPLVSENAFKAFKKVDRKLFVPNKYKEYAYTNTSIPLARNSSISQPSLVAEMVDLLDLKGREKVLEIGSGSGYNSALLSHLAEKVFTIEIDKKLAKSSRERLNKLGYKNVTVMTGDGSKGIPEESPFDVIIITAAVAQVPPDLNLQLKDGGKILLPLEDESSDTQILVLRVKNGDKFMEQKIIPVKFVPLIYSFNVD